EALHDYMAAHGIGEQWETRERVLVGLTGAAHGEMLIRRAARIAARVKGQLIGVNVHPQDGLRAAEPELLDQHRVLLKQLGGEFRAVVGEDVARALLQVARAEQVTQIVLGASQRSRWAELVRGSVINTVIRDSGPIDVHVISAPATASEEAIVLPRRRLPTPTSRRRAAGLLVAAAGLPLLTALLSTQREHVGEPSVLLLYLSLSVAAAAVGGLWPGVLSAVGGFLLSNFFFISPIYTFTIAAPENVLSLIVFVVVAVVVSALVDLAARRTAEAARASAESAALTRLAGTLLDSPDPLPRLVHDLRAAFGLDAVAILRAVGGDRWTVEASAGEPVPARPADGTDALELCPTITLVLAGPRTPADDRRVLAAFAAQLAVAVANRTLQAEAADATALARANRMRSALLAAVSHDLRTPLASIKASATSLLQPDVQWAPADVREFLEAIVGEVDRLNRLVGNLLDMSRLQAGALEVAKRPVGLEEVVPAALLGLANNGPPRPRGRCRDAAARQRRSGVA
ncbi:MAG: DUF4118 domain-containing protein, partial [Gemmatimonadales bacterium]